jgi:peptidoglycan/LPS O-acetylase OafA/YrhL
MEPPIRVDHAGRLREIDGWRAFCALLVILDHAGANQHTRLFSRIPGLVPLIDFWGQLGVKIFFVISGFVICRLLILEEKRDGFVSLKGFYYRRAARILPPFYVYLATISLLLCGDLIYSSWRTVLCSALFLFDINHLSPSSRFVAHTWSLAVEEQFYLLFPSLFVLTSKGSRMAVSLAVLVAVVLWNLSTTFQSWDPITSAHTREGFACISFGVLMAVCEFRVRDLARRVPALLVALGALILLVHPIRSSGLLEAAYESILVPPAIGLLLIFSLERGPLLRRILCCKPVQALGITSYGIYLWQELFTAPKVFIDSSGARPNFSPAGQIISHLLPLMFVVVPLSYFLIEKPAMRMGRFLSQRAKERAASTVYVS